MDSHCAQHFRNSATAGNNVGIIRSGNDSGGKSKPSGKPTAVETIGLSDEDDSAERESILQSPPKGVKRLSSGVSFKL